METMEIKSILAYTVCLFALGSCFSAKTISSNNEYYSSLYTVKRIKGNNPYYIDVARNDSVFRVLSFTKDISIDSEGIKIGKSYPLHLIRILPNKYIQERGMDDEIMDDFQNDIYPLHPILNKKSHYSIYVVSNLDGLHITENDKNEKEILENYAIRTTMCSPCKQYQVFFDLFVK